MRIIVDTNLWISFLIGKRLNSLLDILSNPSVTLVVSSELIDEIELVARRSKFSKFFSRESLDALLDFMRTDMLMFKLGDIPSVCRDPKDDYLLELSRIANADYLVTGDKDLLSLKRYMSCDIVTVAELGVLITNNEDF